MWLLQFIWGLAQWALILVGALILLRRLLDWYQTGHSSEYMKGYNCGYEHGRAVAFRPHGS